MSEAEFKVLGLNRQEGVVDAELCRGCRDQYLEVYEPWLRGLEFRKGLEPGELGGTEIVDL